MSTAIRPRDAPYRLTRRPASAFPLGVSDRRADGWGALREGGAGSARRGRVGGPGAGLSGAWERGGHREIALPVAEPLLHRVKGTSDPLAAGSLLSSTDAGATRGPMANRRRLVVVLCGGEAGTQRNARFRGERSSLAAPLGQGSHVTSRREPGRDEPRVLMTIAVSVQPGLPRRLVSPDGTACCAAMALLQLRGSLTSGKVSGGLDVLTPGIAGALERGQLPLSSSSGSS